jgi:hypothetical protein
MQVTRERYHRTGSREAGVTKQATPRQLERWQPGQHCNAVIADARPATTLTPSAQHRTSEHRHHRHHRQHQLLKKSHHPTECGKWH